MSRTEAELQKRESGRRCSSIRKEGERGRPEGSGHQTRQAPGWGWHRSRTVKYAQSGIRICHRVGPPRTRAHGNREDFSRGRKRVFVQCSEFTASLQILRCVGGCDIRGERDERLMIQKSVEQHLERALDHLPTSFAKLAFLAAVRDPYTGRYLHEGWTLAGSREEIHETLGRAHEEVFQLVCSLPMPELCAELSSYLRGLSVPFAESVRVWGECESYRDMMPNGICSAEREFFASQLRIALRILIIAPHWAQREVTSWRFLQPGQQFRRHLEN